MYYKENYSPYRLPVYDVTELTMEEALLVLSAEKEAIQLSLNNLKDASGAGHEVASAIFGFRAA